MATSPSLPYDIVGHIIDILAAEGDLTPVKNVSLTSSSLLHFCRTHIFHSISTHTHNKSLKKPLTELLVNNPAIVQYIRTLECNMNYGPNEPSPLCQIYCTRSRFVSTGLKWIVCYDQHYFISCIFLPSPTL